MKNFKKMVIGIIIVLLILIMIGIIGYFVYGNFSKQESSETDRREEVEEKIENLDEVKPILVKNIEQYGVWRLENLKKYPNTIDYSLLLVDDSLIIMAMESLSNCNNNNCSKISKAQLDNYFEKGFNLKNIEHKDVICFADKKVLYKYDEQSQEYSFSDDHFHGKYEYGASPIHTKVYNLEKVEDNYILTLNFLYADLKDTTFIAADPQSKIKIADFKNYVNSNGELDKAKIISDYETNYDQNKEKYPKYKYTFNKTDSNDYYLVKYEVIK